jgi:hypothetical protein
MGWVETEGSDTCNINAKLELDGTRRKGRKRWMRDGETYERGGEREGERENEKRRDVPKTPTEQRNHDDVSTH